MTDYRTTGTCLWRRIRSDERGAILVLVAFSLVALIALMALTIDIGKQIRATAQAQNAADAAALAGAGYLAGTPSNVSNIETLAREEAKRYAKQNVIMGDSVDIADGDVTFYRTSGRDSVEVEVRREPGAPDGSLSSIFGGFFGIDELDVRRDAIAEVAAGGAGECMLPVGIMDNWIDVNGNGEFDGSPPDNYEQPRFDNGTANAGSTGFGESHIGTKVVLWADESPGTFNSSWWGPWVKQGAKRGSADYTNRIQSNDCNDDDRADFNEDVDNEPGKMNSQQSAWNNLMSQGPAVEWDGSCNGGTGCVVYTNSNGSQWAAGDPVSGHPRIRNLPAYDPIELQQSPGRKLVTIRNIVGVFVSHWETIEVPKKNGNGTKSANAVMGYLVPAIGSQAADGIDPDDSLVKVVRLVE